jgi:hypothetical protein
MVLVNLQVIVVPAPASAGTAIVPDLSPDGTKPTEPPPAIAHVLGGLEVYVLEFV